MFANLHQRSMRTMPTPVTALFPSPTPRTASRIRLLGPWLRGPAVGLLTVVMLAFVLGSPVQAASATDFAGAYFEIMSANEKTAHFSILPAGQCTRLDLHCSVQVTNRNGTVPDPDKKGPTEAWKDQLEACKAPTAATENSRNAAFDNCWDGKFPIYDLVWPNFTLATPFEISPHCEPFDDECAEKLHFCYNAADCASVLFKSSRWTAVSELWSAVDGCFYSDEWDRMWECADLALWYWFDAHVPRSNAYRTMDFVRKEMRGFILTDYADGIGNVQDADSAARTNAKLLDRYIDDWDRRVPLSIFRPMPEVETDGPRFQPVGTQFLTVDFTSYLESWAASPFRICDTVIGCLNAEVDSGAFRTYMRNFHIVIEDSHVLNCMDRKGWNVDSATAVKFDNPTLAMCDERIRAAAKYCPDKNTGILIELLHLWDMGPLKGLVPDQLAYAVRQMVEEARDRTPECLCAAGYKEHNFVVADHASSNPWAETGALRTKDVCD